MTDDRFDHELNESLRAYESRLPDAAPPAAGASRSSDLPRWPILGVGALAAVAALLLLVVFIRGSADDNIGDASASPMPSASAKASEPAPSMTAGPIGSFAPTPTPQPTASGPEPTANLLWSETASFGSPDMPSVVNDLVQSDGGLVAVGAQYQQPLPNVGPTPPHEGRVWLATESANWEDVTPESIFVNAELRQLLITSDRRLIAHGWVDDEEVELGRRPAAWLSIAGREWEEIDTGFPDQAWPMSMAQGARGHVAIVVEPEAPTLALWWSADGRAWERVHDLDDEGGYRVGAGDEGFVVGGWRTAAQVPHILASGDGLSWLESSPPPGVVAALAPRGGDWVAITRDPEVAIGQPSTAGVWGSLNGIEWASSGFMPLEARDGACTEWPTSLIAAGPWLIAGTIMSYPCSEGGFQTHGAQRISLDGIEWSELPFAPISEEGNLGTRISGAIEIDGRLILVGEQDRVATFWVGEQP